MAKYAYSMDEERFDGSFDTAEDAFLEGKEQGLADFAHDKEKPDSITIWVGEIVQNTADDFIPPIYIVIEAMQENAYDIGSDFADGYLDDITKEQEEAMNVEFKAFIKSIFEKHKIQIEPYFWRVENVQSKTFEVK